MFPTSLAGGATTLRKPTAKEVMLGRHRNSRNQIATVTVAAANPLAAAHS